jgi:hypothetical protein
MPDRDSIASTVMLLTREGLGSGEPGLQLALLGKCLGLLLAGDLMPRALCFYTDGVHLVCEGSPVLEALRSIERRGCRLLVCTTCLEFYGLKDRQRVGTACAMPDILNAQLEATKVITV